MPNACVIILQGATRDEREEVHEVIKEHANGWWHNFVDVWIAGGQTSSFWTNVIVPEIENGSAKLLVMNLPSSPGERSYGAYMTDDEVEWLDDEYMEASKKPEGPGYAPEGPGYAPEGPGWNPRNPTW